MNPFQLVANYSQVGHKQVREAAYRLQEAAEGVIMLGDGKKSDDKEGEASKVSGMKAS